MAVVTLRDTENRDAAPADGISCGFGAIFSACLDYERALRSGAQGKPVSLTTIIKDLASKTGLSERNLWRLRTSVEDPYPETLSALAAELPSLAARVTDSATVRASWKVVGHHQDKMSNGTTLTIISATDDPKAMRDKELGRRLYENIMLRSFKYVFLYPPVAATGTHDPSWVQDKVAKDALSAALGAGIVELDGLQACASKLKASIAAYRTNASPRSWDFWGRMPRYTVLYNVLGPPTSPECPKYGMFWERGLSGYAPPEQANREAGLLVEGWTYLHPEDADPLFEALESQDSSVLDPEILEAFPRPPAPLGSQVNS